MDGYLAACLDGFMVNKMMPTTISILSVEATHSDEVTCKREYAIMEEVRKNYTKVWV